MLLIQSSVPQSMPCTFPLCSVPLDRIPLPAGTPADELEHLEGVMSRVCNFHVADSKPMQVPGPDQVRCCGRVHCGGVQVGDNAAGQACMYVCVLHRTVAGQPGALPL